MAMDVEVAIALRYPPPAPVIPNMLHPPRGPGCLLSLQPSHSHSVFKKEKKGRVNTPPPVVETLMGWWCSLTFSMIPLARNDGLAYLSRKPVVFNY